MLIPIVTPNPNPAFPDVFSTESQQHESGQAKLNMESSENERDRDNRNRIFLTILHRDGRIRIKPIVQSVFLNQFIIN